MLWNRQAEGAGRPPWPPGVRSPERDVRGRERVEVALARLPRVELPLPVGRLAGYLAQGGLHLAEGLRQFRERGEDLGFGRIVASEIEPPNLFVNPV